MRLLLVGAFAGLGQIFPGCMPTIVAIAVVCGLVWCCRHADPKPDDLPETSDHEGTLAHARLQMHA